MKRIVLTVLCAAWICALNAAEPAQPAEYVDLGLPSGTLWKSSVEEGLFTHEQAVSQFGEQLPTKEQWTELKDSCQWKWNAKGYTVIGKNGDSIVLPAAGYRTCEGEFKSVDVYGGYWSSSLYGSSTSRAWNLFFEADRISGDYSGSCLGRSVLLVKAKETK